MLYGGLEGTLELRAGEGGSRRLHGRFPYNKVAVLSDGGRRGRPAKEQFGSRAFAYRVERPDEDIHLLVGHSYDRPLASKSTGTLRLQDSDEALTFEATITPQIAATTWAQDVFALILSGIVSGISPGFRIPPERAVEIAEKVEQEPYDPSRNMYGAIIRTILQALLFELSLVTKPAYSETQIQMRNWQVADSGLAVPKGLKRWRP